MQEEGSFNDAKAVIMGGVILASYIGSGYHPLRVFHRGAEYGTLVVKELHIRGKCFVDGPGHLHHLFGFPFCARTIVVKCFVAFLSNKENCQACPLFRFSFDRCLILGTPDVFSNRFTTKTTKVSDYFVRLVDSRALVCLLLPWGDSAMIIRAGLDTVA